MTHTRNTWKDKGLSTLPSYRYFRFMDETDAAGVAPYCEWAEIEIHGYDNHRDDPSDSLTTNIVCDVKFAINS